MGTRARRQALARIITCITCFHHFFAGSKLKQGQTNRRQRTLSIVLRVGLLHVLPGVRLELTMPRISVCSVQTVSHMYRRSLSPLTNSDLHRDMPPAGGFEAVRYKRNLPLRGPSGLAILGGVTALCAYGFYRVGKGNIEKRYVLTKEVRMYEPVPASGTKNVSSDMLSPTGNVAFYGIRPRDARNDWRCLIMLRIGPWLLMATQKWERCQ
jgi:hypothetical protein